MLDIETIARELYRAYWGGPPATGFEWEQVPFRTRERWMEAARRAFELLSSMSERT